MDHEPEKGARDQSDCAGADERQVRDLQASEDQTDDQYKKIIDTEECLDGCQVFLFVFGGREQVQRRGRSAGGKETVAYAADDAQKCTGRDSGLYADPPREEKESRR